MPPSARCGRRDGPRCCRLRLQGSDFLPALGTRGYGNLMQPLLFPSTSTPTRILRLPCGDCVLNVRGLSRHTLRWAVFQTECK